MIRLILLWIKSKINRLQFIKKSKNKGRTSIKSRLVVRNQQYIDVEGGISLGEGCKFLCWDSYKSSIEPQSLYPHLHIGRNFHATRNLTIQCAGNTYIGDEVLIASDVFIIDYNHCLDPRNTNYLDGPLDIRDVYISDGVWIGNNVIVMPGTRIGKKSIIGAGSIVTGHIDDYCIAVGNPARIIKRWNREENIWELI